MKRDSVSLQMVNIKSFFLFLSDLGNPFGKNNTTHEKILYLEKSDKIVFMQILLMQMFMAYGCICLHVHAIIIHIFTDLLAIKCKFIFKTLVITDLC